MGKTMYKGDELNYVKGIMSLSMESKIQINWLIEVVIRYMHFSPEFSFQVTV